MYSAKIIPKMKMSLNCIFLGTITLIDSFTVPICDKNNINGNEVNFDDLKIGDLKFLIWNKKKEMLKIYDPDTLNLWKVALGDNLKDIITEEQIKNKGNGLVPGNLFSNYFSNKDAVNKSLIVIQVPTTGKRNLDDLDDRKRIDIKRPRSFAPSNRVHENINYYIEPKEAVERLGNFLCDGKFCLLYGHRQSGKTTTAYAIEEWLITNHDKEVYIINFNNGIVINDGLEEFWRSICYQLESLNKNRFSFDKHEEASSLSTFVGLFSKLNHPSAKKSILIVDEASYIGGNDANKTIIQSFIGSLRSLKDGCHNQFNLYSILLIGTELIKEFLINYQQVGSASTISPFSAEASLTSTRFTREEIRELLHQYSSDRNCKLDEYGISDEIYLLTNGHKGLVGSCCYYIESKMMVGRCELTRDDWNMESYNLTTYIRRKATYESITRALPNLSENQKNILGHVLLYRTYVGSENDPDVIFLLAEGMVIIEKNLGYEDVLLACAAPILRNIIIYEISTSEITLSERVPDPKTIDPKWLLERTIENLPIQHIFTKKVLNKTTGEPSEYAFQAAFTSILKQLLAQSYPNHLYRVFPEVKEYDDDSGDPRLHLDILLKNGFPRPAYGYELVIAATKKVFDKHVERAKNYSKLHNCSFMYLVHLCNIENDELSNYFGQECSDIIPVHVFYDKSNGKAKLIYKNGETDISIKSFEWRVIWGIKMNCVESV